MADKSTSSVPGAGTLTGTELVPMIQAGNSRHATAQAIANLSPAATGSANSFDLRTTLAAHSSPLVGDMVLLGEGGREGLFVVDLASNWTAAIAADTLQGIFVASTNDATKVYRRIFTESKPEWFGAVGAVGTNDYAAVNGAVVTLVALGGGILRFGSKTYQINSTLTWNGKIVKLIGSGPSYQANDNTIIYCPNSATQTGCINPKNGSSGLGAGSAVRDLTIKGGGAAAVSAANAKLGLGSGLLVQCSGTYENVTALNCEGNGIYALSAPSTPDVSINCNGAVFNNCVGYGCGNNGRATYGVDTNGVCFYGGGAQQNAQFGDYINGTLGNKISGALLEGNTVGPLRLGDSTTKNYIEILYSEHAVNLLAQLDAGGSGNNTIIFVERSTPSTPTITDNTAALNSDFKVDGVWWTQRFGGDSANGTTVVSNGLVLQRLGAKIQMQDNPLTANWFLYNLGGKPVIENGGVQYFSFSTTGLIYAANCGPILTETASASVTNPPAGKQVLFIDTADHKLKRKDSSGTVTIIA